MSSFVTGQPRLEYKALENHGVEFITPNSAAFRGEIDKFVSPNDFLLIQKALPFSVVIKNSGSRPISAFLVRYDLIFPQSGRPTTHHFQHIKSPTGPPLILPGSTFPLTPLGRLSTAIHKRRVAEVNQVALAKLFNERLGEYESQTNIAVSLDSVLFTDGVFAGPDLSNFTDLLQGCARAEEELKAQTSRLDGAELDQYFAKATSSQFIEKPMPLMTEAAHYETHLRETGKQLAAIRNERGTAAMRQGLSSFPRYPRIQRRER